MPNDFLDWPFLSAPGIVFVNKTFSGKTLTKSDIYGNIPGKEKATEQYEPTSHRILDTPTHYVELDQGDLFINGVRVGPRKYFLDIRLVNGEIEIYYQEDYSFIDTSDFKREFLNVWTDGSDKVFPIKIGDKVVGTATGDIENGNYEFSIHDRDFLLMLNQEPVESRPNANDRSLTWCRAKHRKLPLDVEHAAFLNAPLILPENWDKEN